MRDLVAPLAVVALLLMLLCLVLLLFVLRRYVLTRSLGTFDCSLRRESGHAAGGWMLGVARYEADRLDWFRIFTMSPRPLRTLARGRLLIIERRWPDDHETDAVMPNSVIVRCAYGGAVLELAMSELAYNGFLTWLESAPPGVTFVNA